EVHGDVGLKGGGPNPGPREIRGGENQGGRRLLNQGMTPEEVSTQLGMPLGQVRGVLHGEALGVQSRRVKITAEKEQEILAALKKRPVLAEVAGEFGVPVGTVSRIAKENGVKLGGPYVRLPP